MTDCIFCKIVRGEIPSNKIYEDNLVLAFLDIRPISMGHTLVIPKSHCNDIFDMQEKDASAVMLAVKKVANAVLHGLNAEGVNVLNSNRKTAGQEVFHYHAHVIPRYANDKIKLFPIDKYQENDFKGTAEKIKNSI